VVARRGLDDKAIAHRQGSAVIEPKVSVVLAARDAADEIDGCIESVLIERELPLEIIAVDDGSNDETGQRLVAWGARDERCRVIRQEALGLTAALRRGCGLARAPWIARQDVGDRSLPGRLRRQVEAFELHPRLALVSCFTESLAPGGEQLYVDRGRAAPGVEVPVFAGDAPEAPHVGPTSHGSAMFSRRLHDECGGYRIEFALGQDWDLWLRLGERGTFLTVPEVLYRRRFSARSSSFAQRKLQMRFGELSKRASILRRSGLDERPALEDARTLSAEFRTRAPFPGRRREALAYYHFGETLRRRGDLAGPSYLRAAVRADPTLLRAWLRLAQGLSRRRGAPPEEP
jgi:glycosyltransferase involved in cell wall biosynthesis